MNTADREFTITKVINYPDDGGISKDPYTLQEDLCRIVFQDAAPGCFGSVDKRNSGFATASHRRIDIRKHLLWFILHWTYNAEFIAAHGVSVTAEGLVKAAREERQIRWKIATVQEALNWLEQAGFLIFDGDDCCTINLSPLSVDHRDILTSCITSVESPGLPLQNEDRLMLKQMGVKW